MNKLYANNTVDGPSSLEELVGLMREAGMTAAVWMLERYEEIDFKVSDLEEQLECAEHDLANARSEINSYECVVGDLEFRCEEYEELVKRLRAELYDATIQAAVA